MNQVPLTVMTAAGALRAGQLTSVELTEHCLERARHLDDSVGAYVTRFDETARQAAARADAELSAGVDRGPLHGIPVAVKDLLAQSDGPTTAQSLVLDPTWGAGRDSPVVRRLKSAGAVITGKTTTTEFAIGLPDRSKPFPIPRNPWDLDRWPGGSSSGAAAGVAAGMFLAGIGTDTAGSVRVPAAMCGLSGLKPTFGRIPKSGCVPLSYTLDHVGVIARSAADCSVVLDVLAGHDASDPDSVDVPPPDLPLVGREHLHGVRIGVERRHHALDQGDAALPGRFEDALDVLRGLGATITDVEIPHYAEVCTATNVTMACESLAHHRNDLRGRWDEYFTSTRQQLAGGALFSGAEYVQAQRVRRVGQAGLSSVLSECDAIVTPTITIDAPRYDEIESDSTWMMGAFKTRFWNGVGHPALAVPIGPSSRGLPLSMQICGRPFEEALLLSVGAGYQSVTRWHLAQPPATHGLRTNPGPGSGDQHGDDSQVARHGR